MISGFFVGVFNFVFRFVVFFFIFFILLLRKWGLLIIFLVFCIVVLHTTPFSSAGYNLVPMKKTTQEKRARKKKGGKRKRLVPVVWGDLPALEGAASYHLEALLLKSTILLILEIGRWENHVRILSRMSSFPIPQWYLPSFVFFSCSTAFKRCFFFSRGEAEGDTRKNQPKLSHNKRQQNSFDLWGTGPFFSPSNFRWYDEQVPCRIQWLAAILLPIFSFCAASFDTRRKKNINNFFVASGPRNSLLSVPPFDQVSCPECRCYL